MAAMTEDLPQISSENRAFAIIQTLMPPKTYADEAGASTGEIKFTQGPRAAPNIFGRGIVPSVNHSNTVDG